MKVSVFQAPWHAKDLYEVLGIRPPDPLREPATLSVFYRGSFDEDRQREVLDLLGRENCLHFGASFIPSPDMDGMMNQEVEMVFAVTASLTGAKLEALRAAQFRTVLCGVAGMA